VGGAGVGPGGRPRVLREESASPWLAPISRSRLRLLAPCPLALTPAECQVHQPQSVAVMGAAHRGALPLGGRMGRLVHRLRQRGTMRPCAPRPGPAPRACRGVPYFCRRRRHLRPSADRRRRRQRPECPSPACCDRPRLCVAVRGGQGHARVRGLPASRPARLCRLPKGPCLRLLGASGGGHAPCPWQPTTCRWPPGAACALSTPSGQLSQFAPCLLPLPSHPNVNTPAPALTLDLGAPLAYPQGGGRGAGSQSLPSALAVSGPGGGAPGAASDPLPQLYSNLVYPSSTSQQGSPPLLAEPALLSALAAKAARGYGTPFPSIPSSHGSTQGFGVLPPSGRLGSAETSADLQSPAPHPQACSRPSSRARTEACSGLAPLL